MNQTIELVCSVIKGCVSDLGSLKDKEDKEMDGDRQCGVEGGWNTGFKAGKEG